MTVALAGEDIARRVADAVPGAVEESDSRDVWVKPESIHEVCKFLKEDPDLQFDYLVAVSAVDYIDHFAMVYHLVSIARNHRIVLKSRVWDRENPAVASVVDIWEGANFQEREVYDLMGVRFEGHFNLKRLLLWEGFPGHPHRKDYLEAPR